MSGRTRAVLLVILAVSAALRLVAALRCTAIPDYSDMALYSNTALAGGIPAFPPPGYPLFLRAIYSVFGPLNYTAVFVVQSLLSIVTVYLIFLTGRNVYGERAGLFAAGIAAIYPKFIAYNLTTLTEALTIFLVSVMLYAITSDKRMRLNSILTGIVIFAGYIVKPAFIFFAPGALAGSRRRIPMLVTLVAVFGSFLAYSAISGKSEKRGPMMLYKAYNPQAAKTEYVFMEDTELGAEEDVTDEEYIDAVKDFVRNNKWMTLDILFKRTRILVTRGWSSFVLKDIAGPNRLIVQMLRYFYIPVLILGLFGMLRYPNIKSRTLTMLILSYSLLHIVVTIFKMRYRLPVEPAVIVLAGAPLAAIRIGRTREWPTFGAALTFLKERIAAVAAETRDWIAGTGRGLLLEIRRDLDILIVLILLSLALRIYFAFAVEMTRLSQQSLDIVELALYGGFSSSDAPLYPLFLRPILAIFGKDNFTAALIVQGLLNTVCVPAAYLVASRLRTRRAGLIAATIVALYPRFLSYSIMMKPDSIGVFLVFILLIALTVRTGDRGKSVLSGIVSGLAVLLNPLFIYLLPGVFWILKGNRRVFVITLAIILGPLAIKNSGARHIAPVYDVSAYEMNLHHFQPPLSQKLVNGTYENIEVLLGRDWRDNYVSEMDPNVRNFNYINTYSYILVMLIGIAGMIRYGDRENLRTTFPVLLYILLLILCTRLYDKSGARILWEPVLIIYGAILFDRRKQPEHLFPDES